VTASDADEVLGKIVRLHQRAVEAASAARDSERADALRLFAVRIVNDVVSVIRSSIGLWPTLVEISYFQKGRHGLPERRVENLEA